LGAKKRAAGVCLGVLAIMLRGLCASRQPLKSAPPLRRVLILEPFGMGDMISYQPLIHALRQNGYEVRVCARAEWRALYPEVSCWVPSRIPWSSYDEGKKYGLRQYAGRGFRGFVGWTRAGTRGVSLCYI
jgi:hypothetical protein